MALGGRGVGLGAARPRLRGPWWPCRRRFSSTPSRSIPRSPRAWPSSSESRHDRPLVARHRLRLLALAEHEVRADERRAAGHRAGVRLGLDVAAGAGARARAGASARTARCSLAWFAFFYVIWGTPCRRRPTARWCRRRPGIWCSARRACCSTRSMACCRTRLPTCWRPLVSGRCGAPAVSGALLAIRVVLVFGALLGTVGAFRIWWGGSASPSRPLASGLLVLVLPIAAAFADAPRARRGERPSICCSGWASAWRVSWAWRRRGCCSRTRGTARQASSNGGRRAGRLWTLAPTFIYHEAGTALLHRGVVDDCGNRCAVVLRAAADPGPGHRRAGGLRGAGAGLAPRRWSFRLLPQIRRMPRVPTCVARAPLAALDTFDVAARPAALMLRSVPQDQPAAIRCRASRWPSARACGPSRSRCAWCTTAASRCRPGTIGWTPNSAADGRPRPTAALAAGRPHGLAGRWRGRWPGHARRWREMFHCRWTPGSSASAAPRAGAGHPVAHLTPLAVVESRRTRPLANRCWAPRSTAR